MFNPAKVNFLFPGSMSRDVHKPQPFGSFRSEVAPHKVLTDRRSRFPAALFAGFHDGGHYS